MAALWTAGLRLSGVWCVGVWRRGVWCVGVWRRGVCRGVHCRRGVGDRRGRTGAQEDEQHGLSMRQMAAAGSTHAASVCGTRSLIARISSAIGLDSVDEMLTTSRSPSWWIAMSAAPGASQTASSSREAKTAQRMSVFNLEVKHTELSILLSTIRYHFTLTFCDHRWPVGWGSRCHSLPVYAADSGGGRGACKIMVVDEGRSPGHLR